MQRESMEYDVVIVGAGPAGLSAAYELKKLNSALSVCIVEKGSEVGAHIISGAVFEPHALDELIPDWKTKSAPLNTKVSSDEIWFFTGREKALKLPSFSVPKTMHNKDNYIISLGNFCRWLAEQAEELEVEIFPGFSASEILFNEDGSVKGIATGDMGVSRDGQEKDTFTQGIELHAKYTLFAEGARGSLGKQIIEKFELNKNKDPQHFGLGIKELWKIPADQHRLGLVVHSAGWPLSQSDTPGGGFLYHLEDNQVSVGLVTDLSYRNPYVSPFEEFQRYKHHPVIKKYLEGGERIAYGARVISKGGLQSQPTFSFPGGLLVGDDAGTLNFAKIKGTHTAMKSGMLAAQSIVDELKKTQEKLSATLISFDENYRQSWAWEELHTQRNFGPAVHRWGPFWGGFYSFVDINLFNGKLPWTFHDKISDHLKLDRVSDSTPINYPKPDNKISFDKLSSVFLSNTNHEEDQPVHLRLKNATIPLTSNLENYNEPAQRYCPAGVYEIVEENGENRFQINAQNCVHCKTCDIKDPESNIEWRCPEGGGGPNYPNM